MIEQNNISRKWYRESYVWLLIAFPLSAVLGGIVTTYYAITSYDGLVVDDYYKQGLEINRTLERDRAAELYELVVQLQLNTDNQKARILLKGNDAFQQPEKLNISFLHSTRKGFDKEIVLEQISDSDYSGSMPFLEKGHWYVLIEANDWRILKNISI